MVSNAHATFTHTYISIIMNLNKLQIFTLHHQPLTSHKPVTMIPHKLFSKQSQQYCINILSQKIVPKVINALANLSTTINLLDFTLKLSLSLAKACYTSKLTILADLIFFTLLFSLRSIKQ